MDWKKQLKTDERELKALIDRLGEPHESGQLSCVEREMALRSLGEKLTEMRSYVDDCMSGRSAYEKAVLEYKLRVEYPFYCHVSNYLKFTDLYVEAS